MYRALLGGLLLTLPMACAPEKEPPAGKGATARAVPEKNPKPQAVSFEARVLEVAQDYESFGRVDSELRIAPVRCAAPPPPGFGMSKSNDPGTHGRKLYSLFVKERPHILLIDGSNLAANLVGQAIVKETWASEKVKDASTLPEAVTRKIKVRRGDRVEEIEDSFRPWVRTEDGLDRATQKAALFIMLKLDPKTPGTDKG